MPHITFFEPTRITPGYEECVTLEPSRSSASFRLGNWHFLQTQVKSLYGPKCGGKWDLLGYEVTYTNTDIAQEECDRLWQRYLEETGQTEGATS